MFLDAKMIGIKEKIVNKRCFNVLKSPILERVKDLMGRVQWHCSLSTLAYTYLYLNPDFMNRSIAYM